MAKRLTAERLAWPLLASIMKGASMANAIERAGAEVKVTARGTMAAFMGLTGLRMHLELTEELLLASDATSKSGGACES